MLMFDFFTMSCILTSSVCGMLTAVLSFINSACSIIEVGNITKMDMIDKAQKDKNNTFCNAFNLAVVC